MDQRIVRYVGDVHGRLFDFREIVKNSPYPVVQVGDMGIGFGATEEIRMKSFDNFEKSFGSLEFKFIRGNHDNPELCAKSSRWVEDGIIENNVMYCGGAYSIDWFVRTPGANWWETEELTYGELMKVYRDFRDSKPDVMVTHDCPDTVSKKMFLDVGLGIAGTDQIKTRTSSAFQSMFEYHQPKIWIFGHWHNTMIEEINDTKFLCLGELDYADVNLNTGEILRIGKANNRGF